MNLSKDPAAILAAWEEALRPPVFTGLGAAQAVKTFDFPEFRGVLYLQPTEPGVVQQVLLMYPRQEAAGPRPGVVVPFYYPDYSCGYDLRTGGEAGPFGKKLIAPYARELVERGYVVAATQAYAFNYIPEPPGCVDRLDFKYWQGAAAELRRRHPEWNGVGKLVYDTRLALDLLAADPAVDASRLGIYGLSLGGKMAFMTACLDRRIRAAVGIDFGLLWHQTNWTDPWYWTEAEVAGFKRAGMDLELLLAARDGLDFYLVAGLYDTDESMAALERVRGLDREWGHCRRVEGENHGSGHIPPPDAVEKAYRFLDQTLK